MTEPSIAALLHREAEEHGSRPAVDDGDTSLTYGELDAAANAFAYSLGEAGLEAGGRLGVLAGPTLETIIAMYGCAKAGVVFCPVPVMFTPYELAKVFTALAVGAAYVAERFEPALVEAGHSDLARVVPDRHARSDRRPAHRADPEDPCWILWTSGSTAFPKAALIPERSAHGSGLAYAAALQTGPDDSWINFFPLFHSGGLNMIVMHALAAGARLRLMPDGFEPGAAMAIIAAERITRCGGFDVFWNRMRAHPSFANADFSSIGGVTVGGNLQTYDFLEGLGIPLIMTAYASTEGSLVSVTPPGEGDRDMRKLANGVAEAGSVVRILDPDSGAEVAPGTPGEICFRGPLTFLGYDGDASGSAFDADGLFHSGDYGWMDDAGRLWFRGRYKQMVKSGGENISCKEVEIALETLCEEVVAAQVVGVGDDEWGEVAVAFVELRAGVDLDESSVRARLRERLAPFKVPKQFFVVSVGEWPLTLTGKVKRDELVGRAAG